MFYDNKMFKKSCRIILAVFHALVLISTLTSCSLFFGNKKPESKSGNIKITLSASKDINPSAQSKPAPLAIYIYELKTPDTFDNSDFYSIVNNTNKIFSEQSTKVYQAVLMPGERRNIEINLGESSVALGVVAAYRDINHADWNKAIKIPGAQPRPWWKISNSKEPSTLCVQFSQLSISTIKWIKM
ncbi:type VI secretion system lipoprotein TssJ [Erwinia sorbitola]|uniref:Type VI secretion system lipoprotein TssJ n=2 Tax=Erwinia sorbitola TaxID=2681984 RepID=A0A6I6EAT0_9GAMM|nr:type VI secretion system lipoprotein TssJ [Erwinia sorbitola]